MAVTRAADVADQTPEIWAADLYAQAENQTFWSTFEGPPGSTMPVIRRNDLEQGDGDTIRVDIVLALTGDGLTGDGAGSLLEGNEERLKFRQSPIVVSSLQNAVRWTKLGKILINHDMRSTAQNQLAKWLAGKLDDLKFDELTGNGDTTMPTANKWAAGTATSRATVADTDAGGRLTLDTLTELKAYAETEPKIEPITTENGMEYFMFVGHPYAIMQLKRDDEKWAQAQREAQVRGDMNPLFTGSAGIWDGIIIRSSNRVPDSSNGSINVADNVFAGAQALSTGYASYPDWTEEYFSYGQEQGIATWVLQGQKLNVFDLTAAGGAADADKAAIGSMVVYTSAVAPGQP